jgi:hypothetical protein
MGIEEAAEILRQAREVEAETPKQVYSVTEGNQRGEYLGESIEAPETPARNSVAFQILEGEGESILTEANETLDAHLIQTDAALGAHRRLRESAPARIAEARRSSDLAAVLGAVREDVAEGERYRQQAEGLLDYDPEVPQEVRDSINAPDLEDVAWTDPEDWDEWDDDE